ncbi:aromatic acid exporter family protein [Anaerobacillus sp. CMMVII]|uniref:FUSC family protein n=1 Tax=Anaerobacillus sp. CMMVII TaxID=2755588 RepID=UPI0021B7A4E2|nr:aromatic acid exporter family protein [Anaerobacillus sp. CMMVII]MCT8136672.1 aromatic acid exporter family protein [Anaerobacillus sp. CMMVII]
MKSIVGRRIIKTGISVFITAVICNKLELPVEFAVIAAIVTIEPTASDSIRKGLIRFPASAIGAGLAVIFVYLWGPTALTFTLAALLTIFLCQKLKLHDGILVATLTAVAMVPDIHDHHFLTFASRLGTTFIGLTVSSLINFFILPPKFTPLIREKLGPNFTLASKVLAETIEFIFSIQQRQAITPSSNYLKLRQSTEKISELLTFQEREWKYHKIKLSEFRQFNKLKKTNIIMQKILLHLGNLHYVNEPANFTTEERKLVSDVVNSFREILVNSSHVSGDNYSVLVHELDTYLKDEANKLTISSHFVHHFTPKRIVYFELLSINDCLEELQGLYKMNRYKVNQTFD